MKTRVLRTVKHHSHYSPVSRNRQFVLPVTTTRTVLYQILEYDLTATTTTSGQTDSPAYKVTARGHLDFIAHSLRRLIAQCAPPFTTVAPQ